MNNDQAAAVFKAMFQALKSGGILGVVEHRNTVLKPQDPHAASGYVTEDYVIELARNAGFEFLDKSDINANKKDTKDYPEGVWTLPPTLRLDDKDRKKYLAIGESDRMTLKFIKP
jgi:predicted methyltransferase